MVFKLWVNDFYLIQKITLTILALINIGFYMGKFTGAPLTTMLKVRLVIPVTSHNYSTGSEEYPMFEILKPPFITVDPTVGNEVPTI